MNDIDVTKLRIKIPHHVKTDWTCPECDSYYESITPCINHEDTCPSLLGASIGLRGSRPQKRLRTLQESPKKFLPYPTKPTHEQVNPRISIDLSLFSLPQETPPQRATRRTYPIGRLDK